MGRTRTLIFTLAGLAIVAGAFAYAEPVAALSVYDGVNAARGSDVPGNLFGDAGLITTIVNFMLFIAGALAVIMLIFGGFRYVISGGNSAAVTAAKNTILYAIIGLVIAFLAYAIIGFVLGAIGTTVSGGGTGGWSNL